MKTITDMNLSHLILSDDVEYAKQQRNYKIAMSDEKGRLSYSTKLRNPDGSGLLQYSDGFVACSPIPSAIHAHKLSHIITSTAPTAISGGSPVTIGSSFSTGRRSPPPAVSPTLITTPSKGTPAGVPTPLTSREFDLLRAEKQNDLLKSLGISMKGIKNNNTTRYNAYKSKMKS
jgi:hypothetical protein